MMRSKIESLLLLFLVLIKLDDAQLTAVITPRGYNASLDPEASFTFQCDVTGADNIVWLVDDSPSFAQDIIETEELMKAAPSLWMRLLAALEGACPF
jgi:hypothetical protein